MDSMSIAFFIKGILALVCIGAGIVALIIGKSLYLNGLGLKPDGTKFKGKGVKGSLKTVGSVLMTTSFVWGFLGYLQAPNLTQNQIINPINLELINQETLVAQLPSDGELSSAPEENPFLADSGPKPDSLPISGMGDAGVQEARLYSFLPTPSLKDILFETNEYDINSSFKKVLLENSEWLKQHPHIKLKIEGHADIRGTNNKNLALGQRRASAAKNYLINLGVDKTRIQVISYGEEKPICFENDEGCLRQNRRVHFMIADDKQKG